ncbi:MAG: helix-turn-helix domain-containing protein [Hespellia sp.]|nr:helix-turn-helix domain-containing protein [Hespellia sp.]
MSYVTGKIIKELREKKGYTQRQLAEKMQISDKTVSKWETDRGLPDIGLLELLAETLGVSIAELLMGEVVTNENRAANIRNQSFYICPVCGNVIQSVGQGSYHCCGILLPTAEIEEVDEKHRIEVEVMDNEYYVRMKHPMTKEHYISFFCYVTTDYSQMLKLYPEQNAEGRLTKRGHGFLYAYCNQHGLFRVMV